jgi:hypothetical protein
MSILEKEYWMKGSIGIATFSRAEELNQCLESAVNARNGRDMPLIVLHQLGHDSVDKVVTKWRSEIQILLKVEALGKTPLENINLNAIILRDLAFRHLDSDWFLGIEEDVFIGGDSINFIESMMQEYWRYPGFRGVNLGSAISRNFASETTYSRNRYGLQGQAGAIPKKVWQRFDTSKLVRQSSKVGLDAMLERYLKTGFMCWPNLSRYIDQGWNGTHTPNDSSDIYYKNLRESFVNVSADQKLNYIEESIRNPWREDCFNYKSLSTPFHISRNILLHLFHSNLRRIRKIMSRN